MKIAVHHTCRDFQSYRAARVRSLFNVDDASNFQLEADLPIDRADWPEGWQIGVIVGPSGTGKTSMGRKVFDGPIYAPSWPANKPIIDAIEPKGDFNAVTGALAAVGLGSVPPWLRPYSAAAVEEVTRNS
ncbi:MAG: hypothetical protein ACREVW_06390 [Burkholderiales bacterium]